MDGQQTMMNQLLTFVVLERVLHDDDDLREGGFRELLLPMMLCGAMSQPAQSQPTGPTGTTTTGGWDMSNPCGMLMCLAVLGRRSREPVRGNA
jgi:hypothetical protein